MGSDFTFLIALTMISMKFGLDLIRVAGIYPGPSSECLLMEETSELRPMVTMPAILEFRFAAKAFSC